jgi:hypothetical protein
LASCPLGGRRLTIDAGRGVSARSSYNDHAEAAKRGHLSAKRLAADASTLLASHLGHPSGGVSHERLRLVIRMIG